MTVHFLCISSVELRDTQMAGKTFLGVSEDDRLKKMRYALVNMGVHDSSHRGPGYSTKAGKGQIPSLALSLSWDI